MATEEPIPTSDDKSPRLITLSSLTEPILNEIDRRNQAYQEGRNLGPVPGRSFELLTRTVSGHFANGVHLVYGSPGSGKTAFGLQVATDCEATALFVTCEISPFEIVCRILARGIKEASYREFKSGRVTRAQMQDWMNRCDLFRDNFIIADARTVYAPPAWIADQIKSLREVFAGKDNGHILTVVDSIHTWAGLQDAPGATEYDRIGAAVQNLCAIATETESPILTIGEMNREGMRGKSNSLNSGAGSRKLEFGPETVLALDRNLKDEAEEFGFPVYMEVAKNRHGEAGKSIKYGFDGLSQSFTEIGYGRRPAPKKRGQQDDE